MRDFNRKMIGAGSVNTVLSLGMLSLLLLLSVGEAAADKEAENPLSERNRLLEVFDRYPNEAVPFIAEALDQKSVIVRHTAAHLLARIGEPALDALEKALEHPDAEVRCIAIDALAEMGLLDDYWAVILMDAHPLVKRKLQIELLKGYSLPEGRDFDRILDGLMEAYEGASTFRRRHLVEIFSGVDTLTPEAQRVLAEASRDQDREIRRLAFEGILGNIDSSWDMADELMAAALDDESEVIRDLGMELRWELQQVEEVRFPAEGWKFSTDPDNVGRENNWFDEEYDDSGWRDDVPVEASWQDYMPDNYFGAAWYRQKIDVPEVPQWDSAYLDFEGVDEEAWVWLNGQFVGSHEMGLEGWDVRFLLDVAEELRTGESNTLAVKVKNTRSAGGIWRPVRLRILDSGK